MKTEQTTPQDSTTPVDPDGDYVSLDGKKIIFIGNSFIYYGQTVLEKKQTLLTMDERDNDKGYFYQLCKTNGEEVEVTNWTFGGHSLDHLFGGSCAADRGCDGVDHASYLTDRNFDYVVISAGSGEASNDHFEANIKQITDMFRQGNPNVKFVYLCNAASYGISTAGTQLTGILNHLKVLEEQGFTVVDWGNLVTDIISGVTTVPGAVETYGKNSFIIQKSATDGFHPNLLTGYITSLMTYCAITGRPAEGQEYSFCGNSILHSKFNFSDYREKNYSYENATTNFHTVFKSESDMKGIQVLIDRYLAEKPYLYYHFD